MVLHYHPELRPILLRFQFGEGGQLVGEGIFRHHFHQFCLPGDISSAVEFVALMAEFLALELEKHHILQLILEGGGGRYGIRKVAYWS